MSGAMRNPPARLAVLALLLAAVACGDDGPTSPAIAAGERCDGDPATACQSADELLVCQDREWTLTSCEDRCAKDGYYALGCQSTGDGDACMCDEDGDSRCGAPSPTCTGPNELATCEQDAWVHADCDEYCNELDPPRTSGGCATMGNSAGCVCTLAGLPCANVGPTCDSATELAQCIDGTWTLHDCTTLHCGNGEQGHCYTAFQGGSTCSCEG